MSGAILNTFVRDLQQETINILREALSEHDNVALLDHPNHFNAGDLLIWQGEQRYLDMLGKQVGYVCARYSYDRRVLEQRVPSGPLLLHGGGNFGDRYRQYQEFREYIITEHPDRKIIQLPQTIEFRDRTALRRAQRVYGRHQNLTLMIRDREGVERTRKLFSDNEVVFCPDMAFGVGPLTPTAEPEEDVVFLKRRDGESVYSATDLPDYLKNCRGIDWHIRFVDNLRWWPITVANNYAHRFPSLRRSFYPFKRRGFEKQAELIVNNAVDILSSGRVVVTDRLHAAVYSTLMGKPVVMVDNANKKLSAIHRDYLSAAPDAYMVADFDEAAELARSLL